MGKKSKKSTKIRNDEELELEEEIIQLKQKKTRVKNQFTRAKNQLLRMLESDTYDDKEINIVKEKLSTAEEEVNKLLIELNGSNNNKEGVDRTTYEMEKLNEEYSDTQQPMCSRMSRCFKRRKWESLFKKLKKKWMISQVNSLKN